MYNTRFNNYHRKPKNSTIYTPPELSKFIFELLKDKRESIWDWRSTYNLGSHILDPCVGQGALLKPWKTKGDYLWQGVYPTVGIDLDPHSSADWKTDFLSLTPTDFYQKFGKPQLILCNPPFNGAKPKLAPEIWLDKILELFGKDIPLVFFAPIGLRICNSYQGKRYQKFLNGHYPPISSIISLPRTIFPNIEFHTEILIFNVQGLQPHYFYQSNYE